MAWGTSASACTTFARFSSMAAIFSCSSATAMARRPSALARATRMSASAWSACKRAPMFSPTDTSPMSMETISKAVWASRRRPSTVFEMRSGRGQHFAVRLGRAQGADDALADAGDDRLFGGPADQLLQVRPHRHPGLDLHLDAVLGDAVEGFAAGAPRGAVDHLGIDAGLHGLQHVAAGQVDGGRQLEIQFELGLAGGDQRPDHQRHVAAGQVVGLQALGGHAVARR